MKHNYIKLMLVVLLSIASFSASAHDFKVGGIYYNIMSTTDLTAEVTYGGGYADLGTSYSGNVAVPASVSYEGKTYKVTSIGSEAFSKSSQLLSVTLPESVTNIGNGAFSFCASLTDITLPESVTSIGSSAFRDCSSLTSLNIPNLVTAINESTFMNCSSLISITIPDEIKSIANYAFFNCNRLTRLTIPNSANTIGNNTFGNCSSLISVTIGNGITSIGDYAFANCDAMTSVHISDLESWCKIKFTSNISNPLYKGHHLYLNGEEITDLHIPDGITTISDFAFYGGRGFTSLSFPNSVTSIKWCAFADCSNLSSLTIPISVTTIENLAFSGCNAIESVTFQNCPDFYFSSSFDNCRNINEVIFDCNKVTNIFHGVNTVKKITLGQKVKEIDDYAFSGCKGLASVTIQCSPTSLGTSLFNGCTELKSVEFDCDTIPAIISGISTIEQVMLKEGVTTIGSDAFKECSGIYSMLFPSTVTSINSTAFSSTNLKKTIWLPTMPPTGYANAKGIVNYVMNDKYSSLGNTKIYPFLSSLFEIEGVRFVPTNPTELTCDAIDCVYDETVKHTMIQNKASYKGVAMTVENIMPYLAYSNTHIDSLSINTDGTIFEDAFYGCTNLKIVTIGDSISKIGREAFYKCQNLETVLMGRANLDSIDGCFLGNNIKEIEARAFAGCNIKKLYINDRDDILSLTTYSFDSCPIEELYLGGDITWPSHLSSPFYNNTSLRTVTINNKETEIANREFYGCSNLQHISIGNGVRTIGNSSFDGCLNLKDISLGKNVQTIGPNAFSNCTSLVEFTSKAFVPPLCDTQALESINKWECKLIIPDGSKASYQAADQWKEFFFMEEMIFEDENQDTLSMQKCATPTISYANGKLTFGCTTEGARCIWTIKSIDVGSGEGNSISLFNQYQLTVYATAPGYENSDRATATLVWGSGDAEGDNVIRIGGIGNDSGCDVNKDGTVDVADIATIIDEMAALARMQRKEK